MKRLAWMLVAASAVGVANAGYVLDFTGVDADNKRDTRVITDAQITTKTWTLECWARRKGNGTFRLFAQYPGSTYSLFFGSQDSNQNGVDVFMRGGSGWWKSGYVLEYDVWHHLAMTKDAEGTVKVYVDGVLKNSNTDARDVDLIPSANQFLWLGNTYSDGNGREGTYSPAFPGYLAEMRVWNVVRTAAELAASKDVRLSGNETGLVGYWPLNEARGTNVCNKVTSAYSPVLGTGGWIADPGFPLFNGLEVPSGRVDFADPAAIGSDGVILGPATLRYTGMAPATLAVPIFVRPADSAKAGILFTDTNLTLTGNVVVDGTYGSFLKRGAGTLIVQGENCNWSKSAGGANEVTRVPDNGDSPTQGASGLSICDGTMVVDGGKHVAERIYVGRNTTEMAGAETAGHLIIRGGADFTCNNTVHVGCGNGTHTTAPTPCASSLTIEGGNVVMKNLITIGANPKGVSGYNAVPVFNMDGGSLAISNHLLVAESYGSVGTANLNGGTITAVRIYAGSGTSIVNLNGTALRLTTQDGVHTNFGGFTSLKVGTGGAVFDCVHGLNLVQSIAPMVGVDRDGGLVKRGSETLVSEVGHTFCGPVRIEEGRYEGPLGVTNDLLVAAGATYDPKGTKVTVGRFACSGAVAAGTVEVTGELSVTNAFTVAGTLKLAESAVADFGCTAQSPATANVKFDLGTVGAYAGRQRLPVINTGRPNESDLRLTLTVENGVVKGMLGPRGGLIIVFK